MALRVRAGKIAARAAAAELTGGVHVAAFLVVQEQDRGISRRRTVGGLHDTAEALAFGQREIVRVGIGALEAARDLRDIARGFDHDPRLRLEIVLFKANGILAVALAGCGVALPTYPRFVGRILPPLDDVEQVNRLLRLRVVHLSGDARISVQKERQLVAVDGD